VARKRYQQGSLILRGTRVKKWYGRWLEDELQPDGSIIRIHRSEVLGDKSEFPTKRLAQRELDRRLAAINSPIYKAKPSASFEDFAEKWKSKVMIHHEGSTQDSEKSEVKAWVANLGGMRLRDISTEVVQDVITLWSKPGKDKRSEKTIRNRVATLRLVWASAKAWGYVTHDVCQDLVLPAWNREEQPSFTVEQVKQIIDAANEPCKTIFWLVAETGIRRGEICGLNVGDVNLNEQAITVQRSRWKSKLKRPKNGKKRFFALSPQLTERLRFYVEGRNPEEPLFLSKEGRRLHPDNFIKRQLKPILKKLGLDGAAHAFRHGNASLLDHLHAPMKVRQDRLGHADPRTTMGYTHVIGDDHRKVAEQLGEFFAQVRLNLPKYKNGSGVVTSQAVEV
jgi:integrase